MPHVVRSNNPIIRGPYIRMTIIVVNRLFTDLCSVPLVHVVDESPVADVPTGANVCVNAL